MSDVSPVRFLAAVAAREDEGLLDPCVRNLRRMGFDHVAVICVEEFHQETPRLQALFADDPGISVTPAPTEMTHPDAALMQGPILGPLLARHPAEWLLVIDCDEFPILDATRIEDVAELETADLAVLPRYNYARRADEDEATILGRLDALDRVPLIAERANMTVLARDYEDAQPRWSMHSIGPKLMLRPSRFRTLTAGAHGASDFLVEGREPVKIMAEHMVIAHFPFTSYDRFHQKVVNARAHLDMTQLHTNPASAWHWKWWIRRLEQDGLPEEYRREAFDAAEFAERSASGAIRTAKQMFPGAVAAPAGP